MTTGIINTGKAAARNYFLYDNYPNPFNPATTIRFSLPVSGNVTLTVYDINGKQVAILVNGYLATGVHEVKFNAQRLASRIYIYELKAEKFISAKKLLLLK